MVVSKLMCEELGAGARCRLRMAQANQITALRHISEAVEVKSFEEGHDGAEGGPGHAGTCRSAGDD